MGNYTINERLKLRKMEDIKKEIEKIEKKQANEQKEMQLRADTKKMLKYSLYDYLIQYFLNNSTLYYYYVTDSPQDVKKELEKLTTRNKIINELTSKTIEKIYLDEIYPTQLKKAYKYIEQYEEESFETLPAEEKKRILDYKEGTKQAIYNEIFSFNEKNYNNYYKKKKKKFGFIVFLNMILRRILKKDLKKSFFIV